MALTAAAATVTCEQHTGLGEPQAEGGAVAAAGNEPRCQGWLNTSESTGRRQSESVRDGARRHRMECVLSNEPVKQRPGQVSGLGVREKLQIGGHSSYGLAGISTREARDF